jgi:hypothetical protein
MVQNTKTILLELFLTHKVFNGHTQRVLNALFRGTGFLVVV